MIRANIVFKVFVQIFLVITLTFFVSSAYAEDEGFASCCTVANSGQYCLDEISSLECEENAYFEGVSCENFGSCSSPKGCCEIPGGACQGEVLELVCDAEGGIFNEGSCDGISQCMRKGCLIGSQCILETAYECEKKGGEARSDINSQEDCNLELGVIQEGCCASDAGCVYGDLSGCGGTDFLGAFCSEVEQCGCESHAYTDCGLGLENEDVYWYDSCGNVEELVSDCKPLLPGEFGSSSCGDTDEDGKGDSCVSLDCESTWDNSVVDGDGGKRFNGESWCEYQSAVGPGMDLPGTAHYIHTCERGVEVATLCDEGRNSICVYGDLVAEDASYEISVADCVENDARDSFLCKDCNEYDNPDGCCDETPGCVWLGERGTENELITLEVQLDKDQFENPGDIYFALETDKGDEVFRSHLGKEFLFNDSYYLFELELVPGYYDQILENIVTSEVTIKEDIEVAKIEPIVQADGVCVPLVKPTTFFDHEENSELCGEIGVTYENAALWKKWVGQNWKCKEGCGIYGSDFMIGTNQMCTYYGDCGIGYNVVGELYSDGYHRICEGDREGVKDGGMDDKCKMKDWEEFYETLSFNNYKSAGKGLYLGETIAPTNVASQGSDDKYVSDNVWGGYGSAWEFAATDWEGGKVIGNIIMAVGLIVLIPSMLFLSIFTGIADLITWGFQKTRRRDVSYECGVWRAPRDKDQCEKCHTIQSEGGLMPDVDGDILEGYTCTRGLCESLGRDCVLMDPGTEEIPQCVYRPNMGGNDPGPKLRFKNADVVCNKAGPGKIGSCEVKEESGRLVIGDVVDEFGYVNLSFESYHPVTGNLELADCAYGFASTLNYSQMQLFGDQNAIEHNLVLTNFDWISGESFEAYIKCQNFRDVQSIETYQINFEVASESDITTPFVSKVIPEEGYVPFGEDYMKVKLIISNDGFQDDKDHGCVWSRAEDTQFGEVNSNMECTPIGMGSMTECTGKLDFDDELGLENTYYFVCRDEGGNEEGGQPAGGYLVKRSPELLIDFMKCPNMDGEKCSGIIYDKVIDFEIGTSGGAKDGISECKWGVTENGLMPFNKLGVGTHLQTGFEPRQGENKIFFRCEDGYGNIAKNNVSFIHEADGTVPEIKKLYVENQNIKIITNEHSECKYYEGEIIFEDAIDFTSDSTHTIHTTAYDEDTHFMIECRDRFGNAVGPFDAQVIKG